jgi:hypothetical protein
MKAVRVEQTDAAIARQQCGKHVFAAMNQQARIDNCWKQCFLCGVLRLHSEGQWEKLVSQRLELAVGSQC